MKSLDRWINYFQLSPVEILWKIAAVAIFCKLCKRQSKSILSKINKSALFYSTDVHITLTIHMLEHELDSWCAKSVDEGVNLVL